MLTKFNGIYLPHNFIKRYPYGKYTGKTLPDVDLQAGKILFLKKEWTTWRIDRAREVLILELID